MSEMVRTEEERKCRSQPGLERVCQRSRDVSKPTREVVGIHGRRAVVVRVTVLSGSNYSATPGGSTADTTYVRAFRVGAVLSYRGNS